MEDTEAIIPDCYYTQVSIILYHWADSNCNILIVEQAMEELYNNAVFITKLLSVIEQYVQLPEDKVNTAFLMSLIERSDFVRLIKKFDLPDIDNNDYWVKGSQIQENQDKITHYIKRYFSKNSDLVNFSHNLDMILSDIQ